MRIKTIFIIFFINSVFLLFNQNLNASLLSKKTGMRLNDDRIANAKANKKYHLESQYCNHLIADSLHCDQKPHVIFLIHGLNGKDSSFHELQYSILKTYENFKNIHIYSVDYPSSPIQYDFLKLDKKNSKHKDYMDLIKKKVAHLHPLHFAKILNTKIVDFLYDTEVNNIRDCRKYFPKQPLLYEKCYSHRVNMDTPYSFIVHSQGGLTAMAYLNTCLKAPYNQKKCKYEQGLETYRRIFITDNLSEIRNGLEEDVNDSLNQLKKHSQRPPLDIPDLKIKGKIHAHNITNLISLASPFWGSPTANKGVHHENLLRAVSAITALPLRQIIQLTIGSRGISWQRTNMLNRKNITDIGQWTHHYNPGLKVYNVAGIVQDHGQFDKAFGLGDFFFDWFIDSEKHENDVIVSAPEARLDFLYYLENIDDSKRGELRGKTNISQSYSPFDMSHTPIIDDVNAMTVFLMKNNQYLNNKSFNVIKMALDKSFSLDINEKLNIKNLKETYVKKLSNFTSEIKIITPQGYHRPISLIENQISISPETKGVFSQIKMKNTIYVQNQGQNNYAEKIKHHYWQTYYHIGKFNLANSFYPRSQDIETIYNLSDGGHKLNYSLNLLGFEKKNFYTQTLPSFSTYSEVFLKPYSPFKASHRLNSNKTIITKIKQTEYLERIFSLDNNNKLQVNDVKINSKNKFNSPKCQLGVAGQLTPDRFKHTKKAGLSEADYIKNKNTSIIVYNRKTKLSNKLLISEFNGKNYPVGVYLWNKYASNQNRLFSYFNQKQFNIQNPNLSPYRLPTGSVVEVLGRFQQGFIDDFSKIGRKCTPKEVLNKLPLCDLKSIDRYLITSKEIRKVDNIKTKKQIGEKNKRGRILGLRWVNVIDVDMLKPTDSLPVKVSETGVKKLRRGNNCLKDNSPYYYQHHGSVAGYFYRDIESRKLSKKAFYGLNSIESK